LGKLEGKLDALVTQLPELSVFLEDLQQVGLRPCDSLALVLVHDLQAAKQWTLALLDDHKVGCVDQLEDVLDVFLGEVLVFVANMGEHFGHCVPHEWVFCACGAPPNPVGGLVDQDVKLVLFHLVLDLVLTVEE